ncbi:PadR family transcriptional regulator [Maricaulaceae bacterium EIL42A08]|nr:PadR family transcriptional regulator [Maricaulaceae bacterium EIL42A08]
MNITALGYALLGLVRARPRTGYALRKVFETTPMGAFSSSPGSIYPALKKLVNAGLIEKRSKATGGSALHYLTPRGGDMMMAWLRAPVTIDEVASSIDLVLLRFAFLEDAGDDAITRQFLSSFEDAVAHHTRDLEAYLTGPEGQSLSRHGRLAVENGIRGFKAHIQWAAFAKREFCL